MDFFWLWFFALRPQPNNANYDDSRSTGIAGDRFFFCFVRYILLKYLQFIIFSYLSMCLIEIQNKTLLVCANFTFWNRRQKTHRCSMIKSIATTNCNNKNFALVMCQDPEPVIAAPLSMLRFVFSFFDLFVWIFCCFFANCFRFLFELNKNRIYSRKSGWEPCMEEYWHVVHSARSSSEYAFGLVRFHDRSLGGKFVFLFFFCVS